MVSLNPARIPPRTESTRMVQMILLHRLHQLGPTLDSIHLFPVICMSSLRERLQPIFLMLVVPFKIITYNMMLTRMIICLFVNCCVYIIYQYVMAGTPQLHCFSSDKLFLCMRTRANPSSPQYVPHELRMIQYSSPVAASSPHPTTATS